VLWSVLLGNFLL